MRTLLLLVTLAATALAKKLPADWKTCLQEDKTVRDTCLKDAVQQAIVTLLPGSKELGILPLEPLVFSHIHIEGTGPVSVNLTFTDLHFHNVKHLQVQSVDSDWKNNKFELVATTKEPLVVLGDYVTSGKVLILPIVGEGKCNLTFENFVLKLKFTGKESEKNGKKYFTLDNGLAHMETSRLHIYLGNLFKGDKALGDNMNKFLNENWEIILKELLAPISQAFGEGLRLIANRIFTRVPMDQFIPK